MTLPVNTIVCGDNLTVMKMFEDNCIDAIVTDPPAGINFMNRHWDSDKGGRDQWIEWMCGVSKECLRIAKPGAHALVWALPRTSHWTATAWENGGWECREVVNHIFGTGFPKSLNIGKQLDKSAGVEREIIGRDMNAYRPNAVKAHKDGQVAEFGLKPEGSGLITAPATDAAKQWDDWGTALKPAHENWILLRKPVEGTVAQNVLKYGTGGLNIGGCRIVTKDNTGRSQGSDIRGGSFVGSIKKSTLITESHKNGRFPSNVILDDSQCVLDQFPTTKSGFMAKGTRRMNSESPDVNCYGAYKPDLVENDTYGDAGSAARFFYCAKPSKQERNRGCEGLPDKSAGECTGGRQEGSAGLDSPRAGAGRTSGSKNHHPTLKSLALMGYLCRIVTPPNGIVLDPFAGSGSTCIAAMQEGFRYIGIEKEAEYVEIAEKRIAYWAKECKK